VEHRRGEQAFDALAVGRLEEREGPRAGGDGADREVVVEGRIGPIPEDQPPEIDRAPDRRDSAADPGRQQGQSGQKGDDQPPHRVPSVFASMTLNP
jgi:hypothetical protein